MVKVFHKGLLQALVFTIVPKKMCFESALVWWSSFKVLNTIVFMVVL